jgi:hypothetical protein
MAVAISQLLRMSAEELEALFASSPPGPIPHGDAKGTAILDPGGDNARGMADAAATLWQGKVFNAATKTLRNRITPFGIAAIEADVYEGPSLFDAKPCIVIDYSKRSEVAQDIRDEIRLIAPKTYLGRIYKKGAYIGWFALEMRDLTALLYRNRFRALLALVIGIPLLIAILLAMRFLPDRPVTYSNIEDHFKYGSTGGERTLGIPYWLWKVMPIVFADKLPKNGRPGWEAFGFVYEKDEHGRRRDLPVGIQKRRHMGIDRVFLNCAACHATTVRLSEKEKPEDAKVYVGMPAANFDIGRFQQFLADVGTDARFRPDVIVPFVERQAGGLGWFDRILYSAAVHLTQQQLVNVRDRFTGIDATTWGIGRVDTWNAAKAGLQFRLRHLPPREVIGTADLPSIWNQEPRKKRDDGHPMRLHWTGNNDSVEERNLSAGFGTGAFPATADHAAIGRLEDWLRHAKPLPFPAESIDKAEAARGEGIYTTYCADCHGRSGTDFRGKYVGHITPLGVVGTDRHHYDSYSYEVSTAQNMNYAGTPYRFKRFRKTEGYANAPLDGLWLRGPYLHNGSVPTLRDLLEPPEKRPVTFYRGYDLIDRVKVGFRSDVPSENGRPFYLFDTRLPGNGNQGHLWGTTLSDADKQAVVEFLKTF